MEDNEETELSTASDKLLFVSLYLFILIFFIIITNLSFREDREKDFALFLRGIKRPAKPIEIEQKQEDIFFNIQEKQNLYTSDVRSIKQVMHSRFFNWDEIFADDLNVRDYFLNDLSEIISYFENSKPKENKLIFLIRNTGQPDFYRKLSNMTPIFKEIKNIEFVVRIEKSKSENSIRILSSGK